MNGRIAIVYSVSDPAGSGAASKLLEIVGDWGKASCPRAVSCSFSSKLNAFLAGFKEDVLYFDFLDEIFDVWAYLVLSRHSAKSGRPSLTIHTTGNPGEAEHGGRPRELAWSNPRLEKALITTYSRAARRRGLDSKYWIGLEATHHGPTSLSKPITFIEIGSTPSEWGDEEAQLAMAEAVAEALSGPLPACREAAGFGGTHYPEKHTRLMLETDVCYGHVLAKYALTSVDRSVIGQAMDKNYGGAKVVIVEKKAARKEVRDVIAEEAARRGLPVERV